MPGTVLEPYGLPATYVPGRINGIREVPPGATVTLADLPGPGCIRHYYMTLPPKNLRRQILRIWWDHETCPSVECPLSDFFGIGHDLTTADFSSSLFYVAPLYGYNCYIPMPFSTRARITVTNESPDTVPACYIMLAWHAYEDDCACPWRFHAAWRRVMPAYRRGAPLTLMEASGSGRLIGLIYHICKRDSDDRWSHGGGDQLFIDGDSPWPAYVYGVGGEDFAHHAWGLSPGRGPYSGAHLVHPNPGVKRAEGATPFEGHGWEQHDCGRYSMYRFFIPDPIAWRRSIRFTFGTCANEISATTYWYQEEPHKPFCRLPVPNQRAFGTRLTEESTWQPLALAGDIPVAILGPAMKNGTLPWNPTQPVDPDTEYPTDVQQPHADVAGPPWTVRWRRTQVRAGFIDLAASLRPKVMLRQRGLWNYRHLPRPTWCYLLIRVTANQHRNVVLRIGFEDEVRVWHRGRLAGALNRPEPAPWGWNDILLCLGQTGEADEIVIGASQERLARWSAWGLYIGFFEPDESRVPGLAFETFDALPPTADRWHEPWPPGEPPVELPDYRDPAFFV